jgi:hypothetical protein
MLLIFWHRVRGLIMMMVMRQATFIMMVTHWITKMSPRPPTWLPRSICAALLALPTDLAAPIFSTLRVGDRFMPTMARRRLCALQWSGMKPMATNISSFAHCPPSGVWALLRSLCGGDFLGLNTFGGTLNQCTPAE